ncbi:PREDICTED: uncharacterized protein LOC107064945 [Polistes dominula]|uniref:Uncharacterized protein LOC107064945 n=1 Tax=Polistes dominula TaxID=743375 RepID=A0ABM1I092_POLDO|nr:PREDICTED: uncharacterized protein LOC107064945 [Polistes dominula]
MTLIRTLVIISFSILTATEAFNFTITRILDEKILLNNNSIFDFQIAGDFNYNKVYMIIKKPITEKDDILIDVMAERFDGLKFRLAENPINLCKFLAEEQSINFEPHIRQFHFSRVFNFEGQLCPILPGRRKILPYMFPKNITLFNDLGCGDFVYNINIITSSPNNPGEHKYLISSRTTVNIEGKTCSNTLI